VAGTGWRRCRHRCCPPPGAANGTVADRAHLDLGELKGNIGAQNYPVPRAADLGQYRTVVIWCERFSVTFGYAPLT